MKPDGWPYEVYLEDAQGDNGQSGRDALIAALERRSREHYFNGLDDGFAFRIGDVLDWAQGVESPGGRHVDEHLAASFRR